MKENRTVAKLVAGLLIVGAMAIGGVAPAQAKAPGAQVSTTSGSVSQMRLSDTGWD